jgi:Flp pilus assembly protein TadG
VEAIMKIKSETLNQSGASAIEFALVLPVLLLFLFGIIEFSVLFYNKAMITNASREGARVGIRYEWGSAGIGDWTDTNTVEAVVNAYVGNLLITFSGSNPAVVTTVTDIVPIGHGTPRTVTVTYPYTFLILPNFVSSLADFNLTAQTVMLLE